MLEEPVDILDLNYVDQLIESPEGIDKFDIPEFLETKAIHEDVDRIWVENYKVNRDKVVPFPKTNKGVGKVGIFIGASPALKKNYKSLLNLDDKFIIICTPTTLKFLLEKGIKPDYVFAVEGRDHWLADFDCDTSDLTMIASPFIPPEALEKWRGKYWFYMLRGGDGYEKLFLEDWGDRIPIEVGGGNAVSTSFLWAFKFLKLRHFIFTGMSFCYYDDYYFDGRPQQVEKLDNFKDWFGALDMHGKHVNTTPTFINYKIWLEAAMRTAVKYGAEFVNATEDGILGVWPEIIGQDGDDMMVKRKFIPWLNVIPLAETVQAYKEKLNDNRTIPR